MSAATSVEGWEPLSRQWGIVVEPWWAGHGAEEARDPAFVPVI